MKEMFSALEFADLVGRSQRHIRKAMRNKLAPYVILVGDEEYIESEALTDVYGIEVSENSIGTVYKREVRWFEPIVYFFKTLLGFWLFFVQHVTLFCIPIAFHLLRWEKAAYIGLIVAMCWAALSVGLFAVGFVIAKKEENVEFIDRCMGCGVSVLIAAAIALAVSLSLGIGPN